MATKSKGWTLSSSLSYGGLFYSKLMRYYDGYILGMMHNQLKGATVFDVGAGEANFGFEAIKAGAERVFAIENNPVMIKGIQRKKETHPQFKKLTIVPHNMYSGIVSQLSKDNTPHLIHFKRCLYASDDQIKTVLNESYTSLADGGRIFIIQGEENNRLFDDDGFGNIAIDHVLKRITFKIGKVFKNHLHRRFSNQKLEELCTASCAGSEISFLPNSRPAYHFISVYKPPHTS